MAFEIQEWNGVDRRRFEDEILPAGQPAVLRGIAAKWPLVQTARHSPAAAAEYLKRRNPGTEVEFLAGEPKIDGRFFYNDSMSGTNFVRRQATFGQAIDLLLRQIGEPAPAAVALQALPIPMHLPQVEFENRLDLPPAHTRPKIWIGNASTVAPHHDLNDNIGCVAAGRRRFTLFPPEQTDNLYIGPLDATPQGVPISLVDIRRPDLARFPRYERALAAAQVAELDPGDGIYIPYMWWHAVQSLSPFNILVNYWWTRSRVPEGAPFRCLLHGIAAIGQLPPGQRAIWKTLFDHYVFQSNGEPAAHLRPEARGILGNLTSEQIDRKLAEIALMMMGQHSGGPPSPPLSRAASPPPSPQPGRSPT